jgi:SAM-dependent methyltransferase
VNIKEYWDERALELLENPTTDDPCLRELEFNVLVPTLGGFHPKTVLDVGCGDGLTTARLAKRFPTVEFHGIDFSEKMIEIAKTRTGVEFSVGDVLDLSGHYDVIISDRCLINLDTAEDQRWAIEQIANHCNTFIAIENFVETHDNMNAARELVGLEEIPIRWHNLYFKQHRFLDEVMWWFDEAEIMDFASTYYFATRVMEPALTGEYGKFNELAVNLPSFGQFSPVRMAVMW